ncbi:alpha/beta fold hydrolase [Sphingomonas sp. 37zxx]|uniref:alpha/beta fold hydrolase n=1 Tax=Sphingomonas sp. 37zxx TaxID=1550073 RepID=UPI0009DE3549|nr:alpha/beta hydrolase [Sphingomonas sp. 37zxx]
MEPKQANWIGGSVAAAGAVGGGLALWSALAARSAERMAPAEGSFIEVEGARLHYVDRGSGPVLLLVHGLLGNLRHFTYAIVDELAKDFRVIAVDRPGSGYSVARGVPKPDIVQQAAIMVAFADALGLEKPLLVGHSLGGAVALAAGLARPDRFTGLALIAPLTQPMDQVPPVFAGLMAPPGVRELLSWTLAVPMGILNGPAAARVVFAPDPVPADFPTRGGGALTLRPATFRAASADLRAAGGNMAALAPRYAELTLPVSILYGRGDALLDPALHGEATAAVIPGAHLELVEGGHMLPVVHPQATAAFLRAAHARSR